MKKLVLTALAAATALVASSGASAAPIISADFESGFGDLTATGNVAIADGATYGPCCGTSPSYTNKFAAFGGGQLPSGFLSGSFGTVAGRLYTVSLRYGALGGGSEPLTVSVGGTTQVYNPVANNDLFSTFQTASFTFAGSGSSTALSIFSGGLDNVDAIVDDVSVTAVPEPATWGMMLLGFGMVGFGLRSRRKAATRVTFA